MGSCTEGALPSPTTNFGNYIKSPPIIKWLPSREPVSRLNFRFRSPIAGDVYLKSKTVQLQPLPEAPIHKLWDSYSKIGTSHRENHSLLHSEFSFKKAYQGLNLSPSDETNYKYQFRASGFRIYGPLDQCRVASLRRKRLQVQVLHGLPNLDKGLSRLNPTGNIR